jgi:hypothetical protein
VLLTVRARRTGPTRSVRGCSPSFVPLRSRRRNDHWGSNCQRCPRSSTSVSATADLAQGMACSESRALPWTIRGRPRGPVHHVHRTHSRRRALAVAIAPLPVAHLGCAMYACIDCLAPGEDRVIWFDRTPILRLNRGTTPSSRWPHRWPSGCEVGSRVKAFSRVPGSRSSASDLGRIR